MKQIGWYALQLAIIAGTWAFCVYVIAPTMSDPPGLFGPLLIGFVAALLVTVALSATINWLQNIPAVWSVVWITVSIGAGYAVYLSLLPSAKVTDVGAVTFGATTSVTIFFVIVGVTRFMRRRSTVQRPSSPPIADDKESKLPLPRP